MDDIIGTAKRDIKCGELIIVYIEGDGYKSDDIDFNVCQECCGKGEVATDEDDGEGHLMRGVGRVPCPFCKKLTNNEDNDE